MNDTNLEYLVYGMCIMFHLMMGWVFICRKQGFAKKLIGLLMLLVAVQYAKDLVFLPRFYDDNLLMERIASSIDIVTVPLYVLILIEFCRPGWLSKLNAILLEAPFLLLSLLYMLLHVDVFFKAMVGYNIRCWLCAMDPSRVAALSPSPEGGVFLRRGYQLHWLRGVMVLFFAILMFWALSNVCPSPFTDILYMTSSLVGWAVVCYFINKQEMVLRDVITGCDEPCVLPVEGALAQGEDISTVINNEDTDIAADPSLLAGVESMSQLELRLQKCFEEDKVYLDPKLRLSELAARLGTNRTYLSQYFNQSCAQSFYGYVNDYRVRHSMQLLRDTDYTLDVVASMSGFNSISTFRRAFSQANGCSPLQYRADSRNEGR